MSFLSKQVAVILPGKTKFSQGTIPKIKIYIEKRQGGRKNVTFIWRLEVYGINEKIFAKLAKKRFSSSTSIQKLIGKQKKDLM